MSRKSSKGISSMPRNAKLFFIFVVGSLLFPLSSFAGDIILNGYAETGMRSQAEDFEEEEDDHEYTFSTYHINLKHLASDQFRYEVGTFLNKKDYETEDSLDNSSKIIHVRGTYYLTRQKRELSRLDFKLRYKVKRYDSSPSSEYDQIIFSPGIRYERKDVYSLRASAGITNYEYVNAGEKDEFRFFSKLKGRAFLLGKTLTLVSSFRLDTATQKRKNRGKNRNNFLFGLDYKIKNPGMQKVSARGKFGQSDTKDEDTRDDEFDYTYRQFSIKTDHKIHQRIKTFLKYQYFRKNYVTAELDHSAFSISNSWRYVVFADKVQKLYVNVLLKHKDVDYVFKSGSDYEKETLMVRGTYRKKKDWKTSVSLEGNFYEFDDEGKNKNRYYAKLLFEKPLSGETIVIALNIKYRYTDNKRANNTEEQAVRTAFQYRF
jgi:hypothetical protein